MFFTQNKNLTHNINQFARKMCEMYVKYYVCAEFIICERMLYMCGILYVCGIFNMWNIVCVQNIYYI